MISAQDKAFDIQHIAGKVLRRFTGFLALIFLIASPITGQSAEDAPLIANVTANIGADGSFLSPALDLTQAAALGYMIPQALDRFGAPLNMYSLRGEVNWQDDVVFFYSDYVYLYWYEDRVWQLRFDYRYQGNIGGVNMGVSRTELQAALGPAHYIGEHSLYYELLDRGFPARARFYFEDDRLHDVYLYRSDF